MDKYLEAMSTDDRFTEEEKKAIALEEFLKETGHFDPREPIPDPEALRNKFLMAKSAFRGEGQRLGDDDKIVVHVETLSCGTVAVEAKPSYTIIKLRQALARKIEAMFEGYDVELVASSNAHGCAFIFDGHRLANDRTLADLNIQQDATVRTKFFMSGEGTYVSFCFISFPFFV